MMPRAAPGRGQSSEGTRAPGSRGIESHRSNHDRSLTDLQGEANTHLHTPLVSRFDTSGVLAPTTPLPGQTPTARGIPAQRS
jgi:hypothetical protein